MLAIALEAEFFLVSIFPQFLTILYLHASLETINMRPALLSTILFLKAQLIFGATFQAFNGDWCDGDAGREVPSDDDHGCIRTDNRHSFIVRGCSGAGLAISVDGCDSSGASAFVPFTDGECVNVNTGLNWRSFSATCGKYTLDNVRDPFD